MASEEPNEQRQPSLFHAVADQDYEQIVEIFAAHAKNSISSHLAVKSRWCLSRAEAPKSEEKVDEYFQDVSSPKSSRMRYRDSFRYNERPWGCRNSSSELDKPIDESFFHSMMDDLGELIQSETQEQKEEPAHPFKRSRKQTEFYPEEVERLTWEAATVVSNSRPPAAFSVKLDHGEPTEERPALFDGAIANATQPPLIGGGSLGGGSGTILHLACAIDSPFALAIMLVMGADAAAPHTAFRRLMMHEAACCGSSQCLELLLRLGAQCSASLKSTDRGIPGLLLPTISKGKEPSGSRRSGDGATIVLPTVDRSFLSFLNIILDLSRKVASGEMAEIQAACVVLSSARLPLSSVATIGKSCVFSREKDAPFVQQSYSDGHGNTALHWAAFKNETQCVTLLLRYYADPNARALPSGWTPLHDAAYSDASESLTLLLEAGALVDSRANSGATPLCFAAQEDASNAVQILLDRGAKLSARCCGQSRGEGHQLGEDLPGLNQNMRHHHHHHGRFSGYTPLHYCAHYNAWRAARLLLHHSSAAEAMEIPDLSDRLPIHVAAARGSSDVLRELLHAGVRMDTRAQDEETPPPPPSGSPTHQRTLSPASPISAPRQQAGAHNVVTPVSSPVLRSMIPSRPVTSTKPWNCLSQRSIDECRELIAQAEQNWSRNRHELFTPTDRRAVLELLRVGKRFEQMGTGIFIELWPLILSFCGRGWFVPSTPQIENEKRSDSEHAHLPSSSAGSSDLSDSFSLQR